MIVLQLCRLCGYFDVFLLLLLTHQQLVPHFYPLSDFKPASKQVRWLAEVSIDIYLKKIEPDMWHRKPSVNPKLPRWPPPASSYSAKPGSWPDFHYVLGFWLVLVQSRFFGPVLSEFRSRFSLEFSPDLKFCLVTVHKVLFRRCC